MILEALPDAIALLASNAAASPVLLQLRMDVARCVGCCECCRGHVWPPECILHVCNDVFDGLLDMFGSDNVVVVLAVCLTAIHAS